MKALRSATARAVADVISKTRIGKHLTQRDLAVRLRRPHSVVGMIESHQRQVSVPEFITIAETLGADPVALLRKVLQSRAAR
ncbi:MAG: helix-turn-helix transcriptional regulator [Steroidobacteraceae bacterium]